MELNFFFFFLMGGVDSLTRKIQYCLNLLGLSFNIAFGFRFYGYLAIEPVFHFK